MKLEITAYGFDALSLNEGTLFTCIYTALPK